MNKSQQNDFFNRVIMKGSKKKFLTVGGAARDMYRGLESNDIDKVAIGYTAEDLLSMGLEMTGKDFPVFRGSHIEENAEIALLRTERANGKGGYGGFTCETENVTIDQDLLRRDLTINAMIINEDGVFYDPLNGRADIDNKVLRHTSPAFAEDPVRVLRLARFKARFSDFSIAPETYELVLSMRNDLHSLTKERVFKEVKKALSEDKPHLFFITLHELGVLDILFPEIYQMTLVNHGNKYHMEGSIFNHVMLVLASVAKITTNLVSRYASLYHDIGKVTSFIETGTFHEHSSEDLVMELLYEVKTRYKVPNDYYKMTKFVAINHHRVLDFKEKMTMKKIIKTFNSSFFPKNESDLRCMLDAIVADTHGRIILKKGPFVTLDLFESLDALESSEYERISSTHKISYVSGKFLRKDFIDIEEIVKMFNAYKAVSGDPYLVDHPVPKGEGKEVMDLHIVNINQYLHKERIKAALAARKSHREAL